MALMHSRVRVVALLAGLASAAFCQGPEVKPMAQVPDYAMYDAFFFRVMALDQQADKLAAQGKDGSFTRSTVQRQASLTIQEESALKAIAADWSAKSLALAKAAQEARAAGNSQQAQDVQEQRKQMTADHISQIQSAFGPARFRHLDGYVHATSTVRGFVVTPPSK
jgi:hypothetical protein